MTQLSRFAECRETAFTGSCRRTLAARLAEQATHLLGKMLQTVQQAGRRAAGLRRLHESLAMVQGRAADDWPDSARQIAEAAVYGSFCLRAALRDVPSGIAVPGDWSPHSPLLRDFYSQLAAIGVASDFSEVPVDTDTQSTDTSAGMTGSEGDVYERFLSHFDTSEKSRRGVFYTPPAVAEFVVDGVDQLLRDQANCSANLADAPSADSLAGAQGLILDPAAGGGRFLEAVMRHIHRTMMQQWRAAGISEIESHERWQRYVPRHLLPHVCGFELSLAAYIAAHARLATVLRDTGYVLRDTDRIQVYLTNALAGDEPDDGVIPLAGFADEARRVALLKRRAGFTAIVGNPPFANFSANLSPAARDLVSRYKQIDGRRLEERNALQLERNVNDDYVKFLARAEDLLSGSQTAALGFVVNRSLLASATLRGVRARLLRTFERIKIIDLGGDAVGGTGNGNGAIDENVFATSQGVALLLASRRRVPAGYTGNVRYARYRGNRSEKLAALQSIRTSAPEFQTAAADPPDYRFMTSRNASVWRQFASIDNLFTVFAEGLKTGFDQGLIGFTEAETRAKLDELRRLSTSAEALRQKYNVAPRGWAHRLLTHPEITSRAADQSQRIIRFAYRPLDFRYCPWPSALLKSASTVAGRHLDNRNNLCLIVTRQVAGPSDVSHFYVSRTVPDNRLHYSRRGSATYFPLYAAERAASGKRRSLLKQDEMIRCADRLGWRWVDDGVGDLVETLGPESFLHFAYAVFHAPTYRRAFADVLRGGFPRIPETYNRESFIALSALGADLVALHLAEPDYPAASWNQEAKQDANPSQQAAPQLLVPVDTAVVPGFPKYADDRVWINHDQTIGPVAADVWHFRIGGYQMAHKWLKDRRGRVLTATEIENYLALLEIQSETIRLMQRVESIARRFRLFDETETETPVA